MKPVLVFRHTPDDGPGYLARFLEREGVPYRVVRVDAGEPVPPGPEGAAGLALMGGPQSANDDLPWIPAVLDLLRRSVARGVPVLGHCLGGQLLARALGGAVGPSPAKEIGWLPVRKVPGAAASEWLEGLPDAFDVYQWHWESFTIPPGAERVLESDGCPNQAFAVGGSLGLQCHVEMLPEMVEEWARSLSEEEHPRSATVQSREEMLADLAGRARRLHAVADRLYGRWLRGLREK
ncbi:MAG: type 1 glutamine amidotransferase [Deltaproteobacteria bacterium]|nr:type 1 glutamine amidotransferase [Deltaproteobacteria bacterium]